jgi:choline dehydrogenase-like flavoprotein
MSVLVVGSGPAGVSCAKALLAKGARVTMLDAGLRLEPELAAIVERLKGLPREAWAREDVARISAQTPVTAGGVPLKRAYGSDYPFRPDSLAPADLDGIETVPSYAAGGLSTVWGANVLPYREEDLRDWPIGLDALAPHYAAVLGGVAFSARRDDLEALFPLYAEPKASLRQSRQAAALMRDLEAARTALSKGGMSFGQSRLAVSAPDCVNCGLCLTGCPRAAIYDSAQELPALARDPRFSYEGGVVVDRVEEREGGVLVHARRGAGGGRARFEGERVYLGCGALSTTRILLESLGAYDREVRLVDSRYYLFPLLRYAATPDVQDEELHALAQAFLEISDPHVAAKLVHLQLYSYNRLYASALESKFGAAFPLVKRFLGPLLSRLWIVQGYLHSDLSPGMRATLRKSADGPSVLRVVGEEGGESLRTIRNVLAKLMRARGELRAVPLGPMLQPGLPGKGSHFGGSFPMSRTPGAFQSDVLGRPAEFRRVHAVDATTFPTIPATTITLTVMANARRIGSAYEAGA